MRFLEIALGSLNEAVAYVDLLKDLNLLTTEDLQKTLTIAEKVAKQIRSLQKSLLQKLKI